MYNTYNMFEPECTWPGPSEMIYDSRAGESDGMTFFIFYYPPHSTDCYTPPPLLPTYGLRIFTTYTRKTYYFVGSSPANSHLTFLYIAVTLSTLSSRMRTYISVYTACTLFYIYIYAYRIVLVYIYIIQTLSACLK